MNHQIMIKIISLLLLSFVSVYGQMSMMLLRDVINTDPTERDRLLAGLGAPDLDEVPYVGSSTRLFTTLANFTFILEEEETTSPHFRISAVEISSLDGEGDCGQTADNLSRITELGIEIGTVSENSAVSVSSYQEGNLLDLSRLGLGPENGLIRFPIPPLEGDEVIFFIELTTSPSLPVCLQVEFIGIELEGMNPPPPPPTPETLLQYTMRTPNFFYTRAVAYDDVTYNGLRGTICTGGTGSLMDGRVGTDPVEFPEEWVGFTESAGLRIFFNQTYPVSQIRVYVWSDLVNGAATPTGEVRGKSGMRIMGFDSFTEVVNDDLPELQVITVNAGEPMMLDFIELPLRASGQGLLVTEVSVLQEIDSELIDIATGLIGDEVQFVPSISTATTSTPTTQPTIQPPLVVSDIVIFVSIALIACLFFTIALMCLVFVAIFCCMRARAQKEIVRVKAHPSLIRQLSDKYMNPSSKPSYDQFQQPNETYSELDNVYQEVDRHVTLPLPPIPTEESKSSSFLAKEDSYIEMQATPEARQSGTKSQAQLTTMRTFSEDDYVPVTPPHTSNPKRQISDPYVAVTPPEDDRVFNLTQIEEKYEAITPPESADYNMENLGRISFPNPYVTMATKDTPM